MAKKEKQDKLDQGQQEQLLFVMLIQQHQQIAMMGLGKVKNPASEKIERDLSSAKFAIDTLNMLQKYTEGNLPKEMTDYLTQTLTNLKLNYADEKKKGDLPVKEDQNDDLSGENDNVAGEDKESGNAVD